MRILFLGTPQFAAPALEALLGSRHQVVAAVTQLDKPKGRRLQPAPPPVKEIALAHGLECLQPQNLKEEGFERRVRELSPDACVVVAYGKMIPPWLLELPPHGCLNIHASLLPRYRGAAPIQRAIMEGEKETGVTIMLLDEGMDTGPIFKQKALPVGGDDTSGSIHDKLAVVGAELLLDVLESIEKDEIAPLPQSDSLASYAPKVEKGEGRIDWSTPADKIHNLIRALNPAPGAISSYEGMLLKVWRTRTEAGKEGAVPGAILEAKHKLVVMTGKGALNLLTVQPENRDRMTGEEFVRGYRIKVGDKMGE